MGRRAADMEDDETPPGMDGGMMMETVTAAELTSSSASTPKPHHVLSEHSLAKPLLRVYTAEQKDENEERGNWGNDLQFILACMGFSIGLGNVWRFPYNMYKYGGGFLVVYWLMLFLVAFPVFSYELMLGQFTSKGPFHIFRNLMPAAEGIGWTTIYLNTGYAIYYNAIHAYAIFYVFSSFGSPWKRCEDPALVPDTYNTPVCYTIHDDHHCVRGQPHLYYYVKKRCYSNADVHTAFLASLQNCLAHPDPIYGHPINNATWSCGLKLHFTFNATTPLAMLNLNPTYLSTLANTTDPYTPCHGSASLYQFFDHCESEDRDWKAPFHSWISASEPKRPKELTINLAHQTDLTAKEKFVNRARCFHEVLMHGNWENEDAPTLPTVGTTPCNLGSAPHHLPRLWHLFRRYCDATFGPGLTNVSCVRRIVDPVESYSSSEYYTHYAIRGSLSQFVAAGFSYPLVLSLLVAWILVFVGVYKGPKWIGKIVYVTAIFPIIMIIILIIVSVTLDGHKEGVAYYMFFDMCRLKNPMLWLDALVQVYYSLGIGTGGLMTLASYNRFHNDLSRDALIIALSNCIFSFVGGFGVFGVVGFMAKQVGTAVPQVLRGAGSGMAFVVFAQATAALPAGETLAFFFYLMLVLLAIDSEFTGVETILTFFYDEFPGLKAHRFGATAAVCCIGYLLGIPFVSNVGMHIVDILDAALYSHALPIVSFISLAMTMWIYGTRKLIEDIRMMVGDPSGKKPPVLNFFFGSAFRFWYYWPLWTIVSPLVVFLVACVNYYAVYQEWTDGQPGLAWKLVLGNLPVYICMGGALVWNVCGRGVGWSELWRPRVEWGPALAQHRALRTDRYPPLPTKPAHQHREDGVDKASSGH